jgi:hypothetical protein
MPRGGRGRPRIYCPLCTPRKPEDVRASQEHWDRVAFEKRRRHGEVLRGYHEAWKARIASGEQSGWQPDGAASRSPWSCSWPRWSRSSNDACGRLPR